MVETNKLSSVSHQSASTTINNRFFFIGVIIILTSWQVYYTNVIKLEHARNLVRSLNYYVLNHQISGVYWFGQQMTNYPIQEYYQLPDFLDFLERIQSVLGHLDQLTYGQVNQITINNTLQSILIQTHNGEANSFKWTIQDGYLPLFNTSDIQSLKKVMNNCVAMRIQLEIIDIGDHKWNLFFLVEPFSDTSIFVRFYAQQIIDLTYIHIPSFICGIILAIFVVWEYIYKRKNHVENLLYYFLSCFLTITSIFAFSQAFTFEVIFILDGITCCSAWICAIKFQVKDQDYKLSFLLSKSYKMIGRLFVSFAPVLIAFSIFGYCSFCRYSGQFSSLKRTFMSIFYICYYNMTYESMVVTGRSPTISMIFFMTLVLIFTMCMYSGMLVSVFCSYVWGKRQQKIKKDIMNNLKIQCSNCDHKYHYNDRVKLNPKKSINLSQFLHIDFKNVQECIKYKRIMMNRIKGLRKKADQIIEENSIIFSKLQSSNILKSIYREEIWSKNNFIQKMI